MKLIATDISVEPADAASLRAENKRLSAMVESMSSQRNASLADVASLSGKLDVITTMLQQHDTDGDYTDDENTIAFLAHILNKRDAEVEELIRALDAQRACADTWMGRADRLQNEVSSLKAQLQTLRQSIDEKRLIHMLEAARRFLRTPVGDMYEVSCALTALSGAVSACEVMLDDKVPL